MNPNSDTPPSPPPPPPPPPPPLSREDLLFLVVAGGVRDEFQECLAWLRAHGSTRSAATCREAADFLRRSARDPDAIVLLQRWPAEFAAEDILALQQIAPLSPVLVVLDSWCEGESRTGDPVAGTSRIYWYDFPRRMAPFYQACLAGRRSDFLPLAMAPEDDQRPEVPSPPPAALGRIGVCCGSLDDGAALSAVVRAMGYQPCQIDHPAAVPTAAAAEAGPLLLLLWDDAPSRRGRRVSLNQLSRAFPGVPLLALMTFPRVHETARARTQGAWACVAKPWRWPDLQAEIQSLLSGKVSAATPPSP